MFIAASRGEATVVVLLVILGIIVLASIFGSKQSKARAQHELKGCLGTFAKGQVLLFVLAIFLVVLATCMGR